jgi:hypothetical protein
MAGPVWRFDENKDTTCDVCLRTCRGLYVEGEVADNELAPVRAVCADCLQATNRLVVSGETGGRAKAPAYAHNASLPDPSGE